MKVDRLNMLYLSHAPWAWIKQRPHFLAEYLSANFDVSFFCKKPYRKSRLVNNKRPLSVAVRELFVFPFERYGLIKRTNKHLVFCQLRKYVEKFEIVWVTHPMCFEYIRDILSEDTLLIYDCMDDALEFPHIKTNPNAMQGLLDLEEKLVTRCNIIFSSSENLKRILYERYNVNQDIHVINNAIHLEGEEGCHTVDDGSAHKMLSANTRKKLMYIGTISEWLDFDLILESLLKYSDIVYILIGPTEHPVPCHERIVCCPPVDHQQIFALMKKADAVIMPFKVSELIESVNPVKIYEYIFSGKPAISVDYGETRKFSDFIYTYKTRQEYYQLIEKLVRSDLYSKKKREDCLSFARDNTWAQRACEISKIIDSKLSANYNHD